MTEFEQAPLICDRCSADLTPGKGDFYVVRIEAVADPTPPNFSEEDLLQDPKVEITLLIDKMHELSERELLDQVYRQLVLYLCAPCYLKWIEDPLG
jgi:hypothetical protein